MRRFSLVLMLAFFSFVIGFIAKAESKTLFPKNGILKPTNPYKINLNMTQTNYINSRYSLATDLNQDTSISYGKKTPLAAFVIGFAPGFFVHGLGHYYIGKNVAGTCLLVSEILSFYMLMGAFGASMAENTSFRQKTDSDLMGYAGLLLFFGGWAVDFIGAPAELAHEQGEMARKRRFSLDMKDNRVILKYSIAF